MPPLLMSLARPAAWPLGSASWLTAPFCQTTGSGALPKLVVDDVPTMVPTLFTALATAKLRLARLGSAVMPVLADHEKALYCVPAARPTTVSPSGEMPKP